MIEEKRNAFINILIYLMSFLFINLIITLIVTSVVSSIYSVGFQELMTEAAKADPKVELLTPINLVSSLTTLFTYAIMLIALVIFNFKDLKKALGSFKLKWMPLWIILGFGILYGGSYLLSYLISLAGVGESNNQESIVNMIKYGSSAAVFLSVVVCAPVVEEIIYRKSIGDLCLSNSKTLFYLVSIVAFALPHMLSTKAAPLDFILMSLPYLFSGLAFAFAYERTRNIYVTIGIHVLNNLLAFILIVI